MVIRLAADDGPGRTAVMDPHLQPRLPASRSSHVHGGPPMPMLWWTATHQSHTFVGAGPVQVTCVGLSCLQDDGGSLPVASPLLSARTSASMLAATASAVSFTALAVEGNCSCETFGYTRTAPPTAYGGHRDWVSRRCCGDRSHCMNGASPLLRESRASPSSPRYRRPVPYCG